MSEVTASSQRRSSRMFHKMRVQAQGRAHNGKKFRETCETLVVNGQGGLLILKHEIDDGAMLVLTHPETLEEQECRVVFLGETERPRTARGRRISYPGAPILGPGIQRITNRRLSPLAKRSYRSSGNSQLFFL